MKILIVLGSEDAYTTTLRCLRTYYDDPGITAEAVAQHHSREVGRGRCIIKVLELDTDTLTIDLKYEKSVEPKKKIVINVDTSGKTAAKPVKYVNAMDSFNQVFSPAASQQQLLQEFMNDQTQVVPSPLGGWVTVSNDVPLTTTGSTLI